MAPLKTWRREGNFVHLQEGEALKNEAKVSSLAQHSETAVERSSIILCPGDDHHTELLEYSIFNRCREDRI